jgi:hypothetical protein
VIVQMPDLSFREITLLIDTARHENVTVDIAMIALHIWVMQTYTKRGSVSIAQLKAEPAQEIPLRFRAQLIGQGHIHRSAHAGIPTLLSLLRAGGEFGLT